MIGRWCLAASLTTAALLAALMATGSAHAATARSWATCADRTALFQGSYRWYDDIFAQSTGHFCIRVTRRRMLVTDVVHGQPGGVVAYPAIQYGPAYAWHDKGSGLPVQLGVRGQDLGTITASVRSAGHASGEWLSDVDIWLGKNSKTTVHGSAEIVVINRGTYSAAGRRVRIAGTWYAVTRWQTCPAAVGRCWPLMRFAQLRQTTAATVHVSSVLRAVLAWRWLPSWEWLWSVNYGTEIWSGVTHLTDSMTVRWTPVPCICERGTS